MAPPTPRITIPPRSVTSTRPDFHQVFSKQKTQSYVDPAARGPGHTIKSIAWSPQGALIATGSADRMVRVWNPERANVKYSTELRGHTSSVERVAFHPTREAELATCSRDGTVRFWDVRTKSCVHTMALGGDLTYLTWSKDGENLVVGSMQDLLTPIRVAPTHPDPLPVEQPAHCEKSLVNINECVFTYARPATHLLLSNSNGEVKIVAYPSWAPAYTIKAHTSSCLSLALAPSGRFLAIGGSDSLISLYDTRDFICQRTLTTPNAGAIKAVSFSFDGSYVVGAWEMDKESQGLTPELAIFHAETGINVQTIHPSVPPPRPMERQTDFGVSAVAWHPLRYWLAYSPVSTLATELRIIGMGGSL